jgi:hypothetical protein
MHIANAVDATYRSDLRELNELNFARFDAKLEQRVSTLEVKIDQRFATFEARINQRLHEMQVSLDSKLDRAVAEHAFAQLDARIDRTAGELRVQLAEQRADLLKWMFVFWVGTVVPLGGLVVALRIL